MSRAIDKVGKLTPFRILVDVRNMALAWPKNFEDTESMLRDLDMKRMDYQV